MATRNPRTPRNPATLSGAEWRAEMENRTTWVYRAFDADGVLLYVGLTCNARLRFYEKNRSRDHWKSRIASVSWMQFPNRTQAELAEGKAIHEEGPLFNRQPGYRFVPPLNLDVLTS